MPSCSQKRFAAACARFGLNQRERFAHNAICFVRPSLGPEQLVADLTVRIAHAQGASMLRVFRH